MPPDWAAADRIQLKGRGHPDRVTGCRGCSPATGSVTAMIETVAVVVLLAAMLYLDRGENSEG